jgi:hypothetical protein
MKNKIKKIISNSERQGGFLQIIVLIILALLLMKYFGITISGIFNWFMSIFGSVLR